MPYGLIDYNTLNNIAKAIRYKANSNVQYYPRDFAQAINTIRSGGGYDKPVLLTTSCYYINNYDNNIIKRGSLLNFEFVNELPNNVNIIDVTNSGGMSPDNVTLYERYVTNYPKNSHQWDSNNNNWITYYYSGYIYGLYVNNKWNANDTSIVDMQYLFNGCYYIENAFCGRSTTSLHSTYAGCGNLFGSAVCGNNVVDMSGAYSYCWNLTTAVCGPNVKWFKYAFNNCGNLIYGACGDNVIDMTGSYAGCYNLRNGVIGPNVRLLDKAFYQCSNLNEITNIPQTVTSLSETFQYCNNLKQVNFVNGSTLISGFNAFTNCWNLQYVNGTIMDNLHNCNNMFGCCNALLSVPDIYAKTEDLGMVFNNCTNLTNVNIRIYNFVNEQPVFYGNFSSLKINNMFANCYNLTQQSYENFIVDAINYARERDNSIPYFNPQNTYYYDDTVRYNNRVYKYYGTEPFTGEFNNSNWSYRSIYNIQCYYAFYNCKELTKFYYSNLMGGYIYEGAGNKVNEIVLDGYFEELGEAFRSSDVIRAVCPDTVKLFYHTYSNCQNLETAVCGNNVEQMSFVYMNCYNLVTAACGPNVTAMYSTYENCRNLIAAVCGDKVVNMNATYANCHNLLTAACGNNVVNMNMVYQHCHSLTDAVCGPSVQFMNNAYSNCWNLINSACGDNVLVLQNTYFNCQNLKRAVIGNNVYGMINSFRECINIDNDVEIGSNMYNMQNAFYNCRNINNYYINTTRMTSYALFANAFYSASPYNRRNVVITNMGVFNAFTNSYCRAFATSSIYYTNETYSEPVEVNVNGISYNCVRCAYNTTYNCYIYCME